MLMKKNTQLIPSYVGLALVAALLFGVPLRLLASCTAPTLNNPSFENGANTTTGVGLSWTGYTASGSMTYSTQTATWGCNTGGTHYQYNRVLWCHG